jgi:DNA-binding transcriptional LysR family regulator
MHRLEVFLEVIDAGSASAAAKQLQVSQPTVSKQLRRLEEDLGVELFHRESGRLLATDAGEVFARYARTLMRISGEAEQAVLAAGRTSVGLLTIGATTTMGTYVLPALLQSLRRRFPQIEIDLHIGNQQAITQSLNSGSCTLGLFAGRPQDDRLVQLPVGYEELTLIVGGRHRLLGRQVTAQQLGSETFLLRETGSSDRRAQEEALKQWGLPEVRREHVGSSEAIKRLVETGHGVGLLSRSAVDRELADGSLFALDVRPAPPRRLVCAAYRADHVPSLAERALIELMREGAGRRAAPRAESVSDAHTAPLQVEVPHLW